MKYFILINVDGRKPQAQSTNVIGIGKWAHTATGAVPAPGTPAQTSTSAPRSEFVNDLQKAG